MKHIQRVNVWWLALACLLALPLRWGWAGNTHHETGDSATEQRAWWGDASTGYVKHGCLHGTSATTSASIASCRAYVLGPDLTPRQLEYVEDLTARTISYTLGDGTYWLIAHAETTEPVTGWTRSSVTHYLWQRNTVQPLLPSRASWLARVTVAGGAITAVQDWRSSNPFQPNVLRVTDHLWGAIPNDNGNDASAFQAAALAAQRGNVIIDIPPGVYDCDGAQVLAVQGSYSTNTCVILHTVSNVVLRGYGATIRQGATAAGWRLLGVYASTRVIIEGLHLIGHTQTISQQKHGIVVGHNSSDVTIRQNYITNFTGDMISIDGNLQNGALTGFETQHVTVVNNTLKVRVGNGIASSAGGTGSRLALSVIQGRYVKVHNNLIFGGVDLEPNVDTQQLYHVYVESNTFHSGPVTAQSSIGTTYLHDEPVLPPLGAGTTISGGITLTGFAAAPVIGEIYFKDNTFERGIINCTVPLYVCGITGNTFQQGLIALSGLSGGGVIGFTHVANNATKGAYPGQNTFIRLDGLVTYGTFANNIANMPGGYVIASTGPGTGDGGRNVFVHNLNRSETSAGVLNFAPVLSSVAGQNFFNQGFPSETLITAREFFTQPVHLVPLGSPPAAGVSFGDLYTDTSGALCWFNGSAWVVVAGNGTCS